MTWRSISGRQTRFRRPSGAFPERARTSTHCGVENRSKWRFRAPFLLIYCSCGHCDSHLHRAHFQRAHGRKVLGQHGAPLGLERRSQRALGEANGEEFIAISLISTRVAPHLKKRASYALKHRLYERPRVCSGTKSSNEIETLIQQVCSRVI